MLVWTTLPRAMAVADISSATAPIATLSSTQLILSYFAASKDAGKGDAQLPTNMRLHIRGVAVEIAFIPLSSTLMPDGRISGGFSISGGEALPRFRVTEACDLYNTLC